ncbi:MAG: DUF262 domain-containing protein [Terriglobales bacterium]
MKPSNSSAAWSLMDYRNTEIKLDQLVGYFNEEKINLSPIFQRGRVWTLPMRKELIKNIVRHRPIPAIFLYKDEAGAKYSYSILDGKQRLESIIMFIGGTNKKFAITTWHKYIFGRDHRRNVGFSVDLKDGNGHKRFAEFNEDVIRELREYPIPTIEIALNDSTNLDEIINLFVDINQRGAKVTRLNVVRALRQKDPLVEDVYGLIAVKEQRQQDVFTKKKGTLFVGVLKKLNIVASVHDTSAQADRMWEKLLELALFVRSCGRHRKPSEILKTFIKSVDVKHDRLAKTERAKLTAVFSFLHAAYNNSALGSTRLATDQTHFYIMATSLLCSDLLTRFEHDLLTRKLIKFVTLLEDFTPVEPEEMTPLTEALSRYRSLSTEKTTDAVRRKERQQEFIKAIDLL